MMKKVLGLIFVVVMLAGSAVGVQAGCPEIMPDAVYYDSHGAEAYGYELIEAIRLMMLECGSYTVPEADKREHCAVLCKQLLYTQTVGGYNGWGTTLWGVMHASNTYLQTAPRIWNEEAEPTEEIADIFWDVWINGYFTDFRVQNYRTDYFFEGDWSYPAYSIGATYYSINRWQDFSMFDLDENGVLGYSEWVPEEPEIIEFEKTWFKPEKAVLVYVDR